jgi:hypothetical protein
MIEIKPQKGFQEKFLSSKADILIGGGAAGVGKTFAEILESTRHIYNKKIDTTKFGVIFFRRTIPQIKSIGGLWDEAGKLYPNLKGIQNQTELTWKFPSGSVIKFSHLENEKNIYDHQGAQYPVVIFDELCHFSKRQFFYLLSRNRSTCGIKPYIRATCNPDPESFVAEFIQWWINQEDGYPILERSGVLRYFMMDNDNYIWGDTINEVYEKTKHLFNNELKDFKPEDLIKSVTFIPGSIYENKKLLESNPQYLSNLLSLEENEKMRLLMGNWKVKLDGLNLFDYQAIDCIFTNIPTNLKPYYISCDAARFGDDYTVIMVWEGFRVVKTIVITKSEPHDIYIAIENERKKLGIPTAYIVVDADGVGESVKKLGNYKGFHGGLPCERNPETKQKENYKNFKTQCYYMLSDIVNKYQICVLIDNNTCVIDGQFGIKIKAKSKLTDVRELIKQDLKAIKRKDPDKEMKKMINSKEEQKILLNDRSPDFADTLMMRMYFEIKQPRVGIQW